MATITINHGESGLSLSAELRTLSTGGGPTLPGADVTSPLSATGNPGEYDFSAASIDGDWHVAVINSASGETEMTGYIRVLNDEVVRVVKCLSELDDNGQISILELR